MATATEIFDYSRNYGPIFRKERTGHRGFRCFESLCGTVEEALSATGLPAIGSPHPTLSSCFCVSYEPDFLGGAHGAGTAPWFVIRVNYEPATRANFDIKAEEHDCFSEFETAVAEAPARFDVSLNFVPETTKEEGRSEIAVHSYKTSMAWLAAFHAIQGRSNSNTVTIPAPWGIGGSFNVAPDTLLARTYAVTTVRSGLIRVTFRFGIGDAKWHWYRWRTENTQGLPGVLNISDIQGSTNYNTAPLWSV